MKNKKIVIAGGSGFIGREFCNRWGKNNSIIVLGRPVSGETNNSYQKNSLDRSLFPEVRFVAWDGVNQGNWSKELDGADLVVNLAGKSVNCRYTQVNKKAILDSRVDATRALGLAIQHAIHPPELWINVASATIYPHATDKPFDETCTQFDKDFSVAVCKAWENNFYDQRTPFTRKWAMRLAITLGTGGVMVPYLNLLKFGLGGKQGSGKQMYSWVHINDCARTIEWLAMHKQLEGTFNCSSPAPVTNQQFMKTLRTVTDTHFGVPAPKWLLKLGASIIGTETELVLKSRWVLPARLLSTGFQFEFPELSDALNQVISTVPVDTYRLLPKNTLHSYHKTTNGLFKSEKA